MKILQRAKTSEELHPSGVALSPDGTVAHELAPIRSNHSISLSNITSVPNLPKKKTKEFLRKKHSSIIISSPLRNILENKHQKKVGRNKK